MIGSDGVEYVDRDPAAASPAPRRGPARFARLSGVALLALLLTAGAVYLTPRLRRQLLSAPAQPRPASVPAAADSPPAVAPPPAAPVPVIWEELDLDALPDAVAQPLRLGRYYYDRRLPGNFGLAIHYWQRACSLATGPGAETIGRLVAAARAELGRRFSGDSADVLVLFRQGRKTQALELLRSMRADYLDITAPQYIWTSVMLHRRR